MNITLPESKTKLVLKSLPRGASRELNNLRKKILQLSRLIDTGDREAQREFDDLDGDFLREDLILALYPDFAVDDKTPQRDIEILMDATESYTRGVSEATIKNWLRSGGSDSTQTPNE